MHTSDISKTSNIPGRLFRALWRRRGKWVSAGVLDEEAFSRCLSTHVSAVKHGMRERGILGAIEFRNARILKPLPGPDRYWRQSQWRLVTPLTRWPFCKNNGTRAIEEGE